MPRPLSDYAAERHDDSAETRELGITRRTGRSIAAAVSVLLLATLVVNRSGAALKGDGASAAAIVSSGSIELDDDDQGRSLFDLDDLTPVRPVSRCIEVTYSGTILPVALRVQANADGALSDFLDITIERGDGGGFESCDGFERDALVYGGALDGLTDEWIDLGDILNTGDRRTFRIELALQDVQEALGLTTDLEFTWEVVPS